jgi:hypothetical protein
MRLKTILLAVAFVAISFFISLFAMNWLAPGAPANAPVLAVLPPLSPVPRTSTIIAPIAIPLNTIRNAAEVGTPRNFAGKAPNPVPQLLQNADINWTAARGPIVASGAQNTLSLSTPITGTLNVKGSLSANVKGAIGDALGNLLGGNVAKQIGSVNIKALNANAEIQGNVAMTARPMIGANWRLEPNLTAQANLGDTNISVAGAKINVPAQVKPVIDKAVNDQLGAMQQRIRDDPALERSARREWAKACRSIPLHGASSATQPLWLEVRPTKAIAAQPRVDVSALTLMLGIEADTRITSMQTKPDCPFPATLAIVPPGPGSINIGIPIDMPFTEINKIIETQLVGRRFPEDGSGPADLTVKRANVTASGDRLLISLLVSAKEKSWFGLGGEATVYVWGKPALDPTQQILRLTDVELAVESEAAFGLLGAAARAAMPLLQKTLAERTQIDLKPFASNAQKRIASVIADYQKNEDGLRVDAEITSLKLGGIAFDSTTLRVIAEAEGKINIEVSKLPGL